MIQSELDDIFTGRFKDKRTARRANKVFHDLVRSGSSIINRTTYSQADKIGAYRMINNERCTEQEIKQGLYNSCLSHTQNSEHLLCIQDTTAINYTHHRGRIKDKDANLGICNGPDDVFLFCHPTLVIDAALNLPVGFSNVTVYNRPWEKQNQSAKVQERNPVEEKESYRWLESIHNSDEVLSHIPVRTYISDRESDIYELLCLSQRNLHLLIRSSKDRRTEENGVYLKEMVMNSGIRGSYEIEIKNNKSRKTRKAELDLYYCPVRLVCPERITGKYPSHIDIYCVYVKENPASVPSAETPIEWRLLTTHQVTDTATALQCVQWYKQRWYIEELFRVLKTQGFDIESSQLETGAALKRLVLFSLQACIHVLMMKLAFESQNEELDANVYLSPLQIELLTILLPSLEGKTKKQKNPFKTHSLPWAAWMIARLGAWAGYTSQSPPGYITFKRGYDNFLNMIEVFVLLKKNVYKE